MSHSDWRDLTDRPQMAISAMVSASDPILCGSTLVFPVLLRPAVSTMLHIGWEIVPSALMEALMQHFQAGFSQEVSRLISAPRRPSTNRKYNNRWLRFTNWAAEKGIDPLGPTAAQLASFLFSVFENHGLSPQTIKG